MNDFTEALEIARREFLRDEYASRVKAIVGSQLRELAPDAQFEDTGYFNHSAIPDFVAIWEGRERREIFIRSSYAEIVASDDTERRQNESPLFLAIDPDQSVSESGFEMSPEDVRATARSSERVLLTDAFAVAEMSGTPETPNPLGNAVRANFLQGGRGLIDVPVADSLLAGIAEAGANVGDLLREVFVEDAVFRMERTAALVGWALSPDAEITEVQSAVLNGTMSVDELRNVLPWLLARSSPLAPVAFWQRLGGMFSFEALEAVSSDLEGIDISSLVEANLKSWTARRAYLGLNVRENDDIEQAKWAFTGGVLRLVDLDRQVRVSYRGNKLRSRPGGSSPRWTQVRTRVEPYRLRSVSLSGIERSVQIEARSSEDINRDVQAVAASVEDDYFVESVRLLVAVPGEDEKAPVEVAFAESIAIADKAVELGSLINIALEVIGGGKQEASLTIQG